jgi:hypothetical protein
MFRISYVALVLAGTALATPASAGGLLGGSGNCLCGLLSGGTSANPTNGGGAGNPSGAHHRRGSLIKVRSGGGIAKSIAVTTGRKIGHGNSAHGARFDLAGTVSSVAGATVKMKNGYKSVGLAGQVAATANSVVRVKHGHGTTAGPRLANISLLNKTGPTSSSVINVAALNGSGGKSGKLANVAILNKTGTTSRALANVAALNGSGGQSGKIANVSVLNKTGAAGSSAVNVAALNGSKGGSGRVANVSVLNGGHGKGAIILPRGVRLINGVPCGPDGKPLTGTAKITVLAMIGGMGGGGGHGNGGTSNPPTTTPPNTPTGTGNPPAQQPHSRKGGGRHPIDLDYRTNAE